MTRIIPKEAGAFFLQGSRDCSIRFFPKLIKFPVQQCEVIPFAAVQIAEFPLRDFFPHARRRSGSVISCQAEFRVVDAFACDMSIEH